MSEGTGTTNLAVRFSKKNLIISQSYTDHYFTNNFGSGSGCSVPDPKDFCTDPDPWMCIRTSRIRILSVSSDCYQKQFFKHHITAKKFGSERIWILLNYPIPRGKEKRGKKRRRNEDRYGKI
jgi:hypothetical protein